MKDDGFYIDLRNTIAGKNTCAFLNNCDYYSDHLSCAYDNDDVCPYGVYDDLDSSREVYESGYE